MINVFFDTTTFRDDPLRRKSPFKVIERLADLGKLKLHVSEVSRREFITQQEIHFDDQIKKLKSAIGDFRKKIPIADLVDGIEKEVALLQQSRGSLGHEFDEWLKKLGANVHSVSDHHGASVVKKYFEGSPPFSQVKARKDFPDAFIWEAVVDISSVVGGVNVVTGDGPLASGIGALEGIFVYKSLHDFVSSAALEVLLQQTENLGTIMTFLASDAKVTSEYIAEPIRERLRQSDNTPFSKECEATFLDVGELRELDIITRAVEDYGEGLFVLPFSAKIECLIQYYMPKSDYWGSEPEAKPSSAVDWNDHVFQVEDYYDLTVTGTIGFQIEPGALDGRISRMKEISQIFAVSEVTAEEILSVEFTAGSIT